MLSKPSCEFTPVIQGTLLPRPSRRILAGSSAIKVSLSYTASIVGTKTVMGSRRLSYMYLVGNDIINTDQRRKGIKYGIVSALSGSQDLPRYHAQLLTNQRLGPPSCIPPFPWSSKWSSSSSLRIVWPVVRESFEEPKGSLQPHSVKSLSGTILSKLNQILANRSSKAYIFLWFRWALGVSCVAARLLPFDNGDAT